MRITKEIINSLSKEKQKELKERLKEHWKDYNPLSLFVTYIFWTIYIGAFMLIVLPLWKLALPDLFAYILNCFITVFSIMRFVIIIGLIIDILSMLFMINKSNKIKREYFDIKVKVRSK